MTSKATKAILASVDQVMVWLRKRDGSLKIVDGEIPRQFFRVWKVMLWDKVMEMFSIY